MPNLIHFPVSQPVRAVRWFIRRHGIEGITETELTLKQFSKGVEESPYGAVPALVLDDASVLTESAAILAYISAQYKKGEEEFPKDPLGQARVMEALLHHNELSRLITLDVIRPLFGRMLNPAGTTYEQLTAKFEEKREHLTWALKLVDTLLSKQKWIAGNTMTIADYLVICELNQVPFLESVLPEYLHFCNYPNIAAYLESAKTLSGYEFSVAPWTTVVPGLLKAGSP